MAIRIRKIGKNQTIAICAARSISKEGDVYLDDVMHHALSNKFARDFTEEGFMNTIFDENEIPIVEREESNNENRDDWDKQFTCQ